MIRRIVVVGASLAGLRAAETLRAGGFDGTLTLVGEEPHRPYDRPPLSKQVLQGTREPADIFFRRKDGYDALALDLRLGLAATSLDPGACQVTLGDGARVDYDRLIIATGARVRTLPAMTPRGGLHLLRGLDDAIALRDDLAKATRVAIVGAGFIGLEVAACCRARGLAVTVIEALPVPLAPIVGPVLGQLVAAIHRDHGVDLRTGVTVAEVTVAGSSVDQSSVSHRGVAMSSFTKCGVTGSGGPRVSGVLLSDGSRVEADVVVVGVGVTPNTEWLADSGLVLDNGIACDGYGEAAPNVYAAGDVARMHNVWLGGSVRIEHWTNAVEQGVHVATNVLAGSGARARFSSVPYFWSDQYDRKVQFIGRAGPGDEMVIINGSLAERRLTALYRRDNRAVACFALNQPGAVIKYRKLLAEGLSWDAVAGLNT